MFNNFKEVFLSKKVINYCLLKKISDLTKNKYNLYLLVFINK